MSAADRVCHVYDEHFSGQDWFWMSYIEQVIYRYLDCGDLHDGFALSIVLVTIGNPHFNPKPKTIDS